MKRLFLTLEDGSVFAGCSVNGALETAGLLSFYTGVVGYQEVVTSPANLGKIVVFTYPLIGNYGVNSEDAESASVKVRAIVTKEYSRCYSNFRATGSLADCMGESDAALGTSFDTRAILVHLREHGEMLAVLSAEPLDGSRVRELAEKSVGSEYLAENQPVACAQARPRAKAFVLDLGASRSFYKSLAELGVDACGPAEKADVVIVSDAPYYSVEDPAIVDRVKAVVNGRPVLGFGHGASIVAKAAGASVKRVKFGDHGVNVPVRALGGGRNEITVQNHNYEVIPGGDVEAIFTNVHDGSCEGFRSAGHVAGANFVPNEKWLEILLTSVGV